MKREKEAKRKEKALELVVVARRQSERGIERGGARLNDAEECMIRGMVEGVERVVGSETLGRTGGVEGSWVNGVH